MMCVACNKDDASVKDENGSVQNQKKLVKMVCERKDFDGELYKDIFEFTYDSNGRLMSTLVDGWEGSIKYSSVNTYVWRDNAIVVSEDFLQENANGGSKNNYFTYTLSADGLVISKEWEGWDTGGAESKYMFTYNSSHRLRTCSRWNTSVNWEDDRLTKYEIIDEGTSNYSYKYGGKACKGYSVSIAISIYYLFGEELFLAHPELIGCRSNQLPDEEHYTRESEYSDGYSSWSDSLYSYTFDEDGYVTKMVTTWTSGSNHVSPSGTTHDSDEDTETDTYTYTFTWE